MKCEREGCRRQARGDEFCSRYCFERHHGLLDAAPEDPKERAKRQARIRYLERKHDGVSVSLENQDAMTKVVPGHYGANQ